MYPGIWRELVSPCKVPSGAIKPFQAVTTDIVQSLTAIITMDIGQCKRRTDLPRQNSFFGPRIPAVGKPAFWLA